MPKKQQNYFGCYQTTTKINDGVLRLWSKILAASPTAQIRIQTLDFAKSDARSRFIERLNKVNIPLNQVELVAGMGTQDYLAFYSMVDILLDTLPYPGGATTSEALWMGVPTITLAMPCMLGRQAEALLINAGLANWVTQNEDQYIEKAIY